MTEQMALNYIKLFREEWDVNSKTKNAEALDVAIKALEKQIPKKPKGIDKDICPNCSTYNSVIQSRRKARSNDVVYCWHCGTAIECEV